MLRNITAARPVRHDAQHRWRELAPSGTEPTPHGSHKRDASTIPRAAAAAATRVPESRTGEMDDDRVEIAPDSEFDHPLASL